MISNVSPEINEAITCTATATDDDGEMQPSPMNGAMVRMFSGQVQV